MLRVTSGSQVEGHCKCSVSTRQVGKTAARRERGPPSGAAVTEEVADEDGPFLWLFDEGKMPGRDLGIARPGDGIGKLPVVVWRDELIERSGDDEGRHGERGEVSPDVDVVEQVEVLRRARRDCGRHGLDSGVEVVLGDGVQG